MNTTLELIKTPQFLVGTVIAGILVNILSHWLISKFPPKFKNVISTLSAKWRTRTKEMRQERENRIAPLVNNPQEQQFLISLATTKKLSGIINGLVCLFVSLLALAALQFLLNAIDNHKTTWDVAKAAISMVFMAVTALATFQFAVTEFEEANNMVQDVAEARKRQKLRTH